MSRGWTDALPAQLLGDEPGIQGRIRSVAEQLHRAHDDDGSGNCGQCWPPVPHPCPPRIDAVKTLMRLDAE